MHSNLGLGVARGEAYHTKSFFKLYKKYILVSILPTILLFLGTAGGRGVPNYNIVIIVYYYNSTIIYYCTVLLLHYNKYT